MFDLLHTKILSGGKVVLRRPNELLIQVSDDEKPSFYILEKGASKYLYKQIGVSASTSKEVFQISEEHWNSIIEYLTQPSTDNPKPFTLNDSNVRYIVDEMGSLIDMTVVNDETCKAIQDEMDTFLMEVSSTEHTKKFYVEGSGGLIKLVLYREDANITEDNT